MSSLGSAEGRWKGPVYGHGRSRAESLSIRQYKFTIIDVTLSTKATYTSFGWYATGVEVGVSIEGEVDSLAEP